jgi:protein-disulfide isomerase
MTIKSEKLLMDLFSDGQQIIIGDPEATKTLIVFYDYNCPHCRSFFTNTYPALYNEFVATKKLKISLKPVYLGNDPIIKYSYQLLPCLYNIGMFDELHQLLIKNHDLIFTSDFEVFINTLVVENPSIEECISSNKNNLESNSNKTQLKKMGLNGTPTFVIGNKVFTGKIELEIIRDRLHDKSNLKAVSLSAILLNLNIKSDANK